MPDPAWPSSPPEVNYVRLIGPGAGGTATTLASSAAWQALMVANEIACSVSGLNTATTATDFEGVGGLKSATTATGLNTALQLLAGWAQEKPPIAASAVAAYETAVSAMIPAEVAAANRTEQAADVALNPLVLGALTPAIVALDTAYFGEFWAQNASAGAAYGAALAALTAALAVPPPLSPPGAAAAAPAAASAAVAQSAGHAAAAAMTESGPLANSVGDAVAAPAEAMGQASGLASAMGQPMQAAMGAVQPMTGMFQVPLQAAQALSGLPQAMLGALGGSFGVNAAGPGQLSAGLAGGAAAPAAGVAGVGGMPGAGMTSYSRPPSAFAHENAGRPTGLKPGLLGATELRGPTVGGMGGGAMPMAPAAGGGPAQSKAGSGKDGVEFARVVTDSVSATADQRS